MSHAADVGEVLISLATAALLAADADAAQTGELIFRDEWKTYAEDSTIDHPASVRLVRAQSPSWLIPILDRLSRLVPNQPDLRSAVAVPTPPPSTAAVPKPEAAKPLATSPTLKSPPQPQLQEDAVEKLLKDNDDVFDSLINHPFPQALGDGSASLDGFRYYMIQDTLETCACLKMAAPNFKNVENFAPRHMPSLEYVKKSKEVLISMLGVPESIIDTTPRSKNLDASEKYYLSSVRDEDAFFGYYVVLLPCVLSYWRVAERLMDNPSTRRNVVYHPAWIEVDYDRSSADKYIRSTKFDYTPIISCENVEGSFQMWSFELDQLEQPDVVNPPIHAEGTGQEPVKEVQKDIVAVATGEEIAKKKVELIKKYEQILREDFQACGRNVMAGLFKRYERVLEEKLEAIERQRRECNETKRQELLEEGRKVIDNEGTKKMAGLLEKYERMLEEVFEAIEQFRKEHTGEMGQMLLDKMDASGHVTENMAEKYEGILREDVDASGQLRNLYDEQVREELLEEPLATL